MEVNPAGEGTHQGLLLPARPDLHFRRLIDNLPSGAYTCDAQGLITYYNEAAVTVWGRAPKLADPIDRYCGSFKLFSADGAPLDHEQCWMARALHDQKGYNGEEIIVEQPNGRRLTVLAHANPIHDESGRLIGAINMLVDISDRKRNEEAPARLAAIVESSEDAIISKDLDGVIRSWNQSAERLFGYSAEEAIGRQITLILPPDRIAEEAEILSRLRQGNRIEHFETIRQRKDGTLLDISLTISPVIDSTGRVVGASKIARDISEQKQSEARLREQAHTLATINRVAGTLAAELDLGRLVQAVTDASTELSHAEFGAFFYNVSDDDAERYSLYSLSGASREAFGERPMPRNTEVFSPTFRGEGVIRSDDITEDPRYGKTAPHYGLPDWHLPVRSYLAVPVISRSGEVLGGIFLAHSQPAVFAESSEEIVSALASHAATAIDNARLYDEARRLNGTLEDEVEKRTADLRALNEELETFNYSVAHDLRGSLRGIDGFSQVILEESGNALSVTSRDYLARVRRAARHMGDVIDNLLELSGLVRAPVVRSDVDLAELARLAFARLQERNGERQVTLTIATPLRARGDEGLLRVVLDNLLSNAWKFTQHCNGAAHIEIGRSERDGEQIYFVRDNGAGFDMAYADKLYKPFQRLHQPGEYEGTGIGLATVQRIIDKHGGRIWAEGEPGAGSTFWFTLGG